MAQPIDLTPLDNSPVFAGIPLEEREHLIKELNVTTRRFRKGDVVRRKGDILDFYPVVLKGRIQSSIQQGGQDCIVAQFTVGDSFAEAVPETLRHCPVDIRAVEDSCILCIPAAQLATSKNPWVETMRTNFTKEISKKILVLSKTLQVLGEPRLSDRILAYLDTLPKHEDGSVTVPFDRQGWAGCLRVVDKSLIRELRVMQDAEVIEVDGRRIKVLREGFRRGSL